MAGGSSTVQLAQAVCDAGGLGFIAGGYLSPEEFEQDIIAAGERTFGVNLFVPESTRAADSDLSGYRSTLASAFKHFELDVPDIPAFTDDSFEAKVEVVVKHAPACCTFTFGLPKRDVVARVQSAGTVVGQTVTTLAEAEHALEVGADFLVVQGPEAGGHSGQFDQAADPSEKPLDQLLSEIRTAADCPLVAAGGIGTPERAAEVLELGAQAVQIGTRFLTTAEAGTKPCHRKAILSGSYSTTARTRAFSGRPARGLLNEFIQRYDSDAVVGYPQVNTMVGKLKKAAGDDPAWQNLWAGTAFSECREETAGDVVSLFAEYLNSH